MPKKDEKSKQELQEDSYKYYRMVDKLLKNRSHDFMSYENACKEIGRLQGFEEGVTAATRLMQ